MIPHDTYIYELLHPRCSTLAEGSLRQYGTPGIHHHLYKSYTKLNENVLPLDH